MREEWQEKNICRRGFLWFGAALLLTAALMAGSMRVQAATPYETNGRLSIKDGKVVNSAGNAYVLKGVSTHGLSWFPEYVNKEAFKTMRDNWGVNTVRLAMYTANYNGYCNGGNKNELKQVIDNGVKYATELGLYVIIDWHILSDGNPLTYKSEANKFFKEIAGKYSGYGNVMFEICNEPNGGGGSWKNIKSYANTIIKTIRSVNTDAIIIVGTPTWCQEVDKPQADPINGYSNLAYSFHFYAGTHKGDLRNRLENAVKSGLPVIVSEFGISDASGSGGINKTEGNNWISLLDKYSIGRVCWSLCNKNESSALLKSSCKKTSGWTNSDLSGSGKWLVETYTGKKVPSSGSGSDSSSAGNGGTSSNSSSGSSSTDKNTKSSETKKKTSTGKVKITATLKKENSWESNGKKFTQYKLTLKNKSSKTSRQWQVKVKLKKSFSVSDKWCASFKKKGKTLTIKPLSWNKKLKKGATTEIGFIVKSSSKQSISSITVTAK